MLELSNFGNKKSGPQSRKDRGQAMASIGVEESNDGSTVNDTSRGGFPASNFSSSDPSRQAASDSNQAYGQPTAEEEVADQLQRELELFAQDDDEEASTLIKTDNQPDYGGFFD